MYSQTLLDGSGSFAFRPADRTITGSTPLPSAKIAGCPADACVAVAPSGGGSLWPAQVPPPSWVVHRSGWSKPA